MPHFLKVKTEELKTFIQHKT